MYLGIATPTEAAAAGAFGALIIPLIRRQIDFKGIRHAFVLTLRVSTMIFMIIIGAMIFGYFLTATQAVQSMIAFIGNLKTSKEVIFLMIVVLYLFLGCFLDVIAILLITLPLIYPLAMSLGYNAIWFGIIVIKLIEIGLITPPLGMNAYVVSAATGVPLAEVFKGVGMMLIFELVTLILLILFPIISIWLPSMMFVKV